MHSAAPRAINGVIALHAVRLACIIIFNLLSAYDALYGTGVCQGDLGGKCVDTLAELAATGNNLSLSHPTLENYLVSVFMM